MTIEQVILLVAAGLLANVGIIAALLFPRPRGMNASGIDDDGTPRSLLGLGSPTRAHGTAFATSNGSTTAIGSAAANGATSQALVPPAALDRIVRVVSLVFIATAGVTVTVGGGYASVRDLVYLVLTIGTLAVVFIGDLIPERWRVFQRVLQMITTIVIVTSLVWLTGGATSPFVVGYFLIVGASALSTDDFAPMLLSTASSFAYVLAAAITPEFAGLGIAGFALVIFHVAALLLLAYIATVAGRQQRRARSAALRLARFDPLSGLLTRATIFSAISAEVARAARIGRGFCVLMLDLDELKAINDTFGHQTGDDVLKATAETVKRSIRQTDLAGRFGGDEFVVLLPETDAGGALILAEKLRRDVAGTVFRAGARTFQTTVSVGLVSYPEDGTSLEELMAAADGAMYESKRRGKNQVVGYVTRTERVPVAEAERPPREPVGPGRPTRAEGRSRATTPRSFEPPPG